MAVVEGARPIGGKWTVVETSNAVVAPDSFRLRYHVRVAVANPLDRPVSQRFPRSPLSNARGPPCKRRCSKRSFRFPIPIRSSRRCSTRRSGSCASRRAISPGTRRRSISATCATADIPEEVRRAGAEWWSLRAWMEHGATPYGAERLRDAIYSHQPFEVKQHITNFIAEELRHHEASFRIAQAIGAGVTTYEPTPRADYFQSIIPKFHDERDERAMSFFAGLAVNTLFEQLSGELLTARYENARFASIKRGLQADPARRSAAYPVRPDHHAPLLRRACPSPRR